MEKERKIKLIIEGEVSDKMRREVQELEDSLNDVGETGTQAMDNLSTSGVALGATIGTFVGSIAGEAFKALTGKVIESAQAVFNYSVEIEKAEKKFINLTGSMDKTKTLIQDIQTFSRDKGAENDFVSETQKKLLRLQVTAQDTFSILDTVMDTTASLGGDSEMAESIQDVLNNAIKSGQASLDTLKELEEAGIPAERVWAGLEKTTGKTRQQLVFLARDGSLSVGSLIDSMNQFNEQNKFGDEAEKQTNTFSGAISKMGSVLLQEGQKAFEPYFEKISKFAAETAEDIQKNGLWQTTGEVIGKGIVAGLTAAIAGTPKMVVGYFTSGISESLKQLSKLDVEKAAESVPLFGWLPSLGNNIANGILQQFGLDTDELKRQRLQSVQDFMFGDHEITGTLKRSPTPTSLPDPQFDAEKYAEKIEESKKKLSESLKDRLEMLTNSQKIEEARLGSHLRFTLNDELRFLKDQKTYKQFYLQQQIAIQNDYFDQQLALSKDDQKAVESLTREKNSTLRNLNTELVLNEINSMKAIQDAERKILEKRRADMTAFRQIQIQETQFKLSSSIDQTNQDTETLGFSATAFEKLKNTVAESYAQINRLNQVNLKEQLKNERLTIQERINLQRQAGLEELKLRQEQGKTMLDIQRRISEAMQTDWEGNNSRYQSMLNQQRVFVDESFRSFEQILLGGDTEDLDQHIMKIRRSYGSLVAEVQRLQDSADKSDLLPQKQIDLSNAKFLNSITFLLKNPKKDWDDFKEAMLKESQYLDLEGIRSETTNYKNALIKLEEAKNGDYTPEQTKEKDDLNSKIQNATERQANMLRKHQNDLNEHFYNSEKGLLFRLEALYSKDPMIMKYMQKAARKSLIEEQMGRVNESVFLDEKDKWQTKNFADKRFQDLEKEIALKKEKIGLDRQIFDLNIQLANDAENSPLRIQVAQLEKIVELRRREEDAIIRINDAQLELNEKMKISNNEIRAGVYEHLARQKSLNESIADGINGTFDAIVSKATEGLDKLNEKSKGLLSFITEPLKAIQTNAISGIFTNIVDKIFPGAGELLNKTGNPMLDESKTHTTLLKKIADNTSFGRSGQGIGGFPSTSPGHPNALSQLLGGFGIVGSGGGGYFGAGMGGGVGNPYIFSHNNTGDIITLPNGEQAYNVSSGQSGMMAGLSTWSNLKGIFGKGGIFGKDGFGLNTGTLGGVATLATVAGSLIGGRAGTYLSNIGSGALMGLQLGGPIGAAIGAVGGLIMSIFGGNKQRKADEQTRNSLMLDTLDKLGKIKAEMEAAKQGINPTQLISDALSIQQNYYTQANALKDKKTRNIAIKDGRERVDPLVQQIQNLSVSAKLKEEIRAAAAERDRRVVPEFASGVFMDSMFGKQYGEFKRRNGMLGGVWSGRDYLPSLLADEEMVLNPFQQQKVRQKAGFDVFAHADIPNYSRKIDTPKLEIPKFNSGVNLSNQSSSGVGSPAFNFNGNIILEGFIATPDAKAYLESPDGKRQLINIVSKGFFDGQISTKRRS